MGCTGRPLLRRAAAVGLTSLIGTTAGRLIWACLATTAFDLRVLPDLAHGRPCDAVACESEVYPTVAMAVSAVATLGPSARPASSEVAGPRDRIGDNLAVASRLSGQPCHRAAPNKRPLLVRVVPPFCY